MRFLQHGSGPDVYARTGLSSNVVSVFGAGAGLPLFDARWGGVQAMFSVPVNTVSIDAAAILPPEYLGTPTNRPWIEAFGAGNVFLGITYYPILYGQPGYGSFQTLTVNSATDIQYVIFSSQHANDPAVYGEFDNLTFSAAQQPGGAVPEPSSMLLLGSGLFGIAGVVRRKLGR